MDVQRLKVDYLTIVGHKFYGPRIGALYVRGLSLPPGKNPHSPPLYPLFFGGGQERSFRPGTENTPMIAGLGEAARLVSENLASYAATMAEMRGYLEQLLVERFGPKGVHFNDCRGQIGQQPCLPNTCNFSLLGKDLPGWKILQHSSTFLASLGSACHSGNAHR